MDIQSTDRGKSRIKRLNQLMKNPLILKKSRLQAMRNEKWKFEFNKICKRWERRKKQIKACLTDNRRQVNLKDINFKYKVD